MTTAAAQGWLDALADDRPDVARSTTAELVAAVLRTRVLEGDLRPGQQLPEEAIRRRLGISRNTLRESFRLLTHERLLVHEYSRGVFVRVPTATDVVDLYRARRVIECGAVHGWSDADEDARAAVRAAVADGERATADQEWVALGTANMRFHEAVAGLAGRARLDEEANRLLAELRLVFHTMGDPRRFHERYLPGNQRILALLEAGDPAAAERVLRDYLDQAEAQLLAAFQAGQPT